MADMFTKAKRSDVMRCIRGYGNKGTELAFAKLLREARITGWRRHSALLGRPDFTFRQERAVIFVDGCFWHGCPKHSTVPVSNRAFWMRKLAGNRVRDRLVTRALRERGWRVLRIWEHELRSPARVLRRVKSTMAGLTI